MTGPGLQVTDPRGYYPSRLTSPLRRILRRAYRHQILHLHGFLHLAEGNIGHANPAAGDAIANPQDPYTPR